MIQARTLSRLITQVRGNQTESKNLISGDKPVKKLTLSRFEQIDLKKYRKLHSNLTGHQVTELIYPKKNRPKQSGNKRKNLHDKPDPKSI